MATYLFVTKSNYTPERVESGIDLWWTCSSTSEDGDFALVYVAGAGIMYEWRLISDAEPNDEWKYICDVQYLRTFEPPIALAEICDVVSRNEWAPPYLHLRGYRSIRVPDYVAHRIRLLRPVAVSA